MNEVFVSALGSDLAAFLEFKRGLGYKYDRAGFLLRELDRCLLTAEPTRKRLDETLLAWLARGTNRKPVSVANELGVVRQFWLFLRRRYPTRFAREPLWPRLPTTSDFEPWVLTEAQVRSLLRRTGRLCRPDFRRDLYRALLLVLYCTGIRFGEALRLHIKDVDLRTGKLFIAESKGRSRWVPFHRSLLSELEHYLVARRAFASAAPDDRFFVGRNRRDLPVNTAWHTIVRLLREEGLKPPCGRTGPRPYDLRHTFAVHRLTRWYRAGVDLQSNLPLLSAYMGHDDIFGTETYLRATPELLALAGERLRRRLRATKRSS